MAKKVNLNEIGNYWVERIFGSVESAKDKAMNGTIKMAFYNFNCLIEARWKYDDNVITLRVLKNSPNPLWGNVYQNIADYYWRDIVSEQGLKKRNIVVRTEINEGDPFTDIDFIFTTDDEVRKYVKKAYLVDFSVRTRVLVEVPEECADKNPDTNDGLWAEIVEKAQDKIKKNYYDYLCYDNATEVVEDTECPAGTINEDNITQ